MNRPALGKEEQFQITVIRILACCSIYICHVFEGYYETTGSMIGAAGGMLFNIGVPIFFILSGYLYSTKKVEASHVLKWYGKQGKKLFIPLWFFLLGVFAVHAANGIYHSWFKWLQNILPVIGITERYLPGCGHLWYITDLIVCYLLTPLFMKLAQPKHLWWIAGSYILIKLVGAYTIPPIYSTLLASIGSYLFGFYFFRISKKFFKVIRWLLPVALILRILLKLLFDGTPLYDNFLVDLCHKFLAVAIIATIYPIASQLYTRARLVQVLNRLSQYTYEFYLVHSPVINGPVALSFSSNYIFIGVVGFVLSAVFAWLLHWITFFVHQLWGREN